VLTNVVALNQFPHTVTASFMFAGAVIVSVSAWHLKRQQHLNSMFTSLRVGLWTLLLGGIGTAISGDGLGLAMVRTQPMKMAAAEALYNSAAPASFSIFTWGTPDGKSELFSIRIPNLLSFLSTHTLDGKVEGLNDLQAQYTALYGPGDYMPTIWITYWAFRWMIGLGVLAGLIALVGLWITRNRDRIAKVKKWAWNTAIWAGPLPVLAIAVGWTFTEMGRQPWLVFKLMKTSAGVSPGINGWDVLISLVVFTLIYGALAVVEFKLLLKAVQAGPEEASAPQGTQDQLAVAY
jgi:cytochrome d ubiquinol oxidase subunit I